MNYLGVDIGTTGCKALAFDGEGRLLASAYREYPLHLTRDGGAELDSGLVMECCFQVIREAAAGAGAGSVAALAVSSQGEAFTPLDSAGNPLHGAMVSSDTRSAAYIPQWLEEFGEDRLYRATGHTAHPMFTLFKLAWMRDQRPQVFAEARRFLCFEDLLGFRLGVDPAMGWPLAGRTMMFDVCRHAWDGEILERAGVREEQLARPLASGSVAGEVSDAAARDLGLRPGALVVTGGHDQTVGALGAGVTSPGVAMYATGTVECITAAMPGAVFSEDLRRANLCTYDHAAPGLYATIAFSLTGGNILKWFRDNFGQQEVLEAGRTGRDPYELLLEQAQDEPSSLMVLPYWTPSGTPYFDPDTPGAIVGLRLSTGRGELLRALLEGVALEMRLNLEILEGAECRVRELRAIGGGARSRFWNQLKADVTGRPVTRLDVTEAGCLGAAMLAASAHSGTPVQELARTWVRTGETLEPDPEKAALYSERLEHYRRLYPTVKEFAARR